VLDPWLGTPRRTLKEGRANLVYRFESEDSPPFKMRLKIEINTREHFTELGLTSVPFAVVGRWFTGSADITTFDVNELLGTKLRALYQRKKGRDLFDMAFALQRADVNPSILLRCFARYMAQGGHVVTRAQFEANLYEKSSDSDFRDDIKALLGPTIRWDFDAAMAIVLEEVVAKLPGDPWKGAGE
jgi:predicted nucleotidyltransferase component of viral defense system